MELCDMFSYPVSTNFRPGTRGHFVFGCVLALTLLTGSRAMGAGKPAAIATILQGGATIIRAVTVFGAIEGIRLQSDDLIRTEKDSFLRLEYEDGTWIELGPETELELGHPADRRARNPALYLLTGWMKLGCVPPKNGAKNSIASTAMDLSDVAGNLIIRTVDNTHSIFAEAGTATWVNRAPHAADTVALSRGDFLVLGKAQSPQVLNRPSPEFVSAMPVEFRDALPNRFAQFSGRNVAGKEPRAMVYADVDQWLKAETSVRRQFVAWWRRKAASDADFRAALDRNLSLHPEWDPVLHPEKYEKDEPPVRPAHN
jgi:hypothetical protein